MKILITGVNGYLGRMFQNIINNTEYIVCGVDNKKIDVVLNLIESFRPDIVIHCGAPSSADYEETEFKDATDNLQKLINYGRIFNFHLIYPQSAIIYNAPLVSNGYCEMKIRHNKMLGKETSKTENINFTFTQIMFPRVYSADRTKGLIRRIKDDGIYNWGFKIKFATKDDTMDFLSEFFERFEINKNLFDGATIVIPERYEMSVSDIKAKFKI